MTSSQRWWLLAGLLVTGGLIYLLQPILVPFLAGMLLAYLGNPLVDRLQRHRLPRTAAVLVVFIGIVLLIAGLVMLLIPMVGAQVDYLRRQLPGMFTWLQETLQPWLEANFGIDIRALLDFEQMAAMVTDHWRETGDVARAVAAHIAQSGVALAIFLFNLVLTPVVTFYLLRDWHRVVRRMRELLPRRLEPRVVTVVGECDQVLGAFLRGQLLVMFSLGAIYTVGLWLIGVELALLIGLAAGLLSIVPYLGTIIGVGAALIATMVQFGDLWPLVAVAVLFTAGNMLESMVLQPWLVGDRIGLHPVWVIFAVLAGGQLFGFVGVLLALPAAAVIVVLLRHLHAEYRGSSLYGEERTDTPPES